MEKNNSIDIKVKCSEEFLPYYASEFAAGADLFASTNETITLKPLERAIVPTSLFLEIPTGYEVQIRPRSGLAAKSGVTVLNSPGTIDSDYRGEIKVILINLGSDDFKIENGMRIAQMVVSPILRANFVQVDNLSESARGEGGFGSTGVKKV